MCQHAHFPRQSNNCQVYANSGLWRGDASMTLHPGRPSHVNVRFPRNNPNFVKNVRLPVLNVRFHEIVRHFVKIVRSATLSVRSFTKLGMISKITYDGEYRIGRLI